MFSKFSQSYRHSDFACPLLWDKICDNGFHTAELTEFPLTLISDLGHLELSRAFHSTYALQVPCVFQQLLSRQTDGGRTVPASGNVK